MALWLRILFYGLLVIPSLAAIWFYGYSIYGARDLFSRPPQTSWDFHPPVSLLKPLCGLEAGAYENLSSFCRQDYPEFQIVFGVQDPHDPSVTVVQQLIRDFPHVDIQLVINSRSIGASPKVSNLANIEAGAKHPLLLIADSDIRVGEDYIRRTIQPMRDPQVGLVTCMHRSLNKGIVPTIEALRISTDFCAGLLVARKLEGVKFALGSTIVVRREALKSAGGFAALGDYLADDFMLCALVRQSGYEAILSDYVVEHALATRGWRDLFQRELRWNRGMRVTRPWGYLGLIFTQGVVTSAAFLYLTTGSVLGQIVLAATWTARLVMSYIVGSRYLGDRAARKYWWMVPVADFVGFVSWCSGFLGNTVDWRGRRFELSPAGKLVLIPVGPTWASRDRTWFDVRGRARQWVAQPMPAVLCVSVLAVVLISSNLRSNPVGAPVAPAPALVKLPSGIIHERVRIEAPIPPAVPGTVSTDPMSLPVPARNPVASALWKHADILGGLSSFGALVLSDGALEREGGPNHRKGDFMVAGRASLLVAWGLELWQQWRGYGAATLSPDQGAWRFRVEPVLESDRGLSMRVVCKRQF